MSIDTIAQPDFELPCNIAAERVVLGNLIEDSSLLPKILASGLCAADFSLSDHARVYRAILALHEQNAPVDPISLLDQLGDRPADLAFITDLIAGAVIEPRHALYHATTVKRKALARKILKIGEWIPQGLAELREPHLLIAEIRLKLDGCSEDAIRS
jgi:replicative DNA helicase